MWDSVPSFLTVTPFLLKREKNTMIEIWNCFFVSSIFWSYVNMMWLVSFGSSEKGVNAHGEARLGN